MLGNPVNYDKKYGNGKFPLFDAKLDMELRRYLSLIPGKNVLDLGIGQGQNSIPLSNLNYNVTGVDFSNKCLEICKEKCPALNLIKSDVRSFEIEKNKYDLILSRYVLHFLHKDDSYKILHSIKDNVKKGGLVYITLFSTEDPKFVDKTQNENIEILDNNIFHNKLTDTYISFFSKEELLNIFEGFKTLYISQEYSLELLRDDPCYHGVIKYIGINNIT